MKTKNILNQNGVQPAKPVEAHKGNFETLRKAFLNGDIALMECTFNATGERVAVICAATRQDGVAEFFPFAVMLNGDPYQMLTPPEGRIEDGK